MNAAFPNNAPAGTFRVTYTGDVTGMSLTDGNDLILYNFVPVPEPGAVLAVCATAAGASAALRRRFRPTAPTGA